MNRAAVLTLIAIAIGAAAAVFFFTADDGDDTATPPDRTTTLAETTTTQPGSTTTSGPAAPDTTTTVPLPEYTPVFEEARCAFDIVTERSHRCGYLVVPENRLDPAGREVRIHVAIFESDDPNAPDDPIVYLDGGPGGESLEPLAFSLEDPWGGFLANRDVIFFDQRGIGHSEPNMDCAELRVLQLDVLDEDLEYEDIAARELAAVDGCRRRLLDEGIDLTQYNSVTNAADVADLRVALGYEEWNLLGISYGTRLAQAVMRDHPEGVRSVILDSVYTPDVDLFASLPDNFARALDILFADCADDPVCDATYDNLETRLFALAERLDSSPLTTTVRDVFTNERYETVINEDVLLDTVFQGLYSHEVIPLLPQMVAELEADDTGILTLLLTNDLANGTFLSHGMYLSVQCNEEVSFSSEAAIRDAAEDQPRLRDLFVESTVGFLESCAEWGAGEAAAAANELITSDLPTLVMAGEYDPITPPEWGRRAADGLANSAFIEFPGVGHAASVAGDCPTSIALAFLDDPAAPLDTSCVATMRPPNFAVPGETAAAPIELVPFEEDVFGTVVAGLVPDGWERIGPGAWARQANFVDQTALVQQAGPGIGDPATSGALVASIFGFDDDAVAGGIVEAGERTWYLSEGTIDGFTADLALSTEGRVTGIVLLVTSPEERDELFTTVFRPILEAFSTS